MSDLSSSASTSPSSTVVPSTTIPLIHDSIGCGPILTQKTSDVQSQTGFNETHNKSSRQSPPTRSRNLQPINSIASPILTSMKQQSSSPVLCSISSPTQSHIHDDSCILDNYNYSLESYIDSDDTDSTIDLTDYTADDEFGNDTSSVGVVICGADKSITHINDAFTRITGYNTADLIGRPSLSLLQGQDTSHEAITTIRTAISTQSPCKVCLINYRKDGQPFWNLLTILPMLNKQSNTVDAWIGIQRLHQPKPYIDKLMKMFPWTNTLPLNTNQNIVNSQQQKYRRKLHAARHNQLTIRNQQRRQPIQHRDNTVNTNTTIQQQLKFNHFNGTTAHNGDGIQADHVIDSANKHLIKPSMHRFSSVDDCTDGEQDIYDVLDNSHLSHTTTVTFISETFLPTQHGTYRVRAYKDDAKVLASNGYSHLLGSESEIICIIAGTVNELENVPVRVHDACFTSEVLSSLKCDCKEQLHWAMDYIQSAAQNSIKSNINGNIHNTHNTSSSSTSQQPAYTAGGLIIYMPQEGRGIGLANKLKAYSLQHELGLDTVDANRILGFPDDARAYNCVPSILSSLNIKSIKLMTNNPRKSNILISLGVHVTGCIPVVIQPNSMLSKHYMETKRNRMDHMMPDL